VVKALALVFLVLCNSAIGKEAAPVGEDPALEQRVTTLAGVLRCLVFQNQTIADSNAPLAIDLKNQVREKMKQGQSDADILAFMVARYGDFVLYRPPFKMTTLVLWLGPLLLLAGGLIVLFRRLARRRVTVETELSPAQRERAASLLATDGKTDKP
jgi:cytochrome c-type biogenesis protein CcmH